MNKKTVHIKGPGDPFLLSFKEFIRNVLIQIDSNCVIRHMKTCCLNQFLSRYSVPTKF